MTLKINKDLIFPFLTKIKMDGSQVVTEIVLGFEDEGLRVYKNSESNTARVEGFLNKDAFTQYDAIGDVGIRRLDILVKLINRFTGEIEIDVQGNIMTISKESKSVGMELVADGVINKDETSPDLEYDNELTFDSKELKTIFDDAKLSDNAAIIFKVNAGVLTITNTGRYKFTNEYQKPDCVVNGKSKFGKPLVDAVANLTGELTIKLKEDNPIEISTKDTNEEIKVIVAPMVDD